MTFPKRIECVDLQKNKHESVSTIHCQIWKKKFITEYVFRVGRPVFEPVYSILGFKTRTMRK